MDTKTSIVIIATRSIPLADGLDALLKAMPQIAAVQIARNLENAFEQIKKYKPQVALIDSVLFGTKPEAALKKIRTLSHRTQRVLLVDDVQAVKWVPQYAEAILIKGISPSAVATIVTNLLSTKGEEHELNDSSQ